MRWRRGCTSRGVFRPRRGTEVIELALLLLPLLWLTFGAVDFGYYFYLEHNVQAAASEGARARIVPGASDQDAKDAVARIMDNAGLASANYSTNIDFQDSRQYVEVKVTMPYSPMGVPPARVPNHSVQGEATMRME